MVMDLKSILIWLLRIPYCRGFGIHSPTDYGFVRYVVNEHYPYYGYDDLYEQLPYLSRRKRKLSELYFRIANWKQPKKVLLLSRDFEVYKSYVTRGCNKSIADNKCLEGIYDLIIIGKDSSIVVFDNIAKSLNDGSVLVVESICDENRTLWNRLIKWDRATICYDLYYAGIVIFDEKREKRQYKINF